jgi:hypothetical protein
MWRSFGVGMREAIDLAKTEPEPPKAAKRKQSCYAQYARIPLFYFGSFFNTILKYILS